MYFFSLSPSSTLAVMTVILGNMVQTFLMPSGLAIYSRKDLARKGWEERRKARTHKVEEHDALLGDAPLEKDLDGLDDGATSCKLVREELEVRWDGSEEGGEG